MRRLAAPATAPSSLPPSSLPPPRFAKPGRTPVTVKFGQDLQVRKLLYQEVRFLSESWYRIFWERRSCTKKCEKTLRMVRLCPAREDPDQIEHLLLPRK